MKDLITGVKLFVAKNTTIHFQKTKPFRERFKNERATPIEKHTFIASNLSNFGRKEKRNFKIERTVDLHGLTKDNAFKTLINFFSKCQKNGIRNVLVITGGNSLRNSVLRASFQKWVRNDFGHFVFKCTVSEIYHGGEGAFYVVIKRGSD